MTGRTSKAIVLVAGLALLVGLLGTAGCQKNEGSAGSLPKAQGNSAVDFGRKVFADQGCVRCHTIGGQGTPTGPDLTRVGADPRHNIDWLMIKVRNPRAMNPASRMPPFDRNKLSDRDLMALGSYLSGLK